jgi:thymidine kinase
MAKLHFKYGTMGSGKTLQLLVTAHNYERQGKKVLIIKPEIDTRFGYGIIKTRIGMERKADVLLQEDPHVFNIPDNTSCILVDEAQFLSVAWIDFLRGISIGYDVPIICYGLKADFKSNLFEASQRLLEVADKIEEIKTVCGNCTRKATQNMKLVDGIPTTDGPSIELGAEEKYIPVCWECYLINTSKVADKT